MFGFMFFVPIMFIIFNLYVIFKIKKIIGKKRKMIFSFVTAIYCIAAVIAVLTVFFNRISGFFAYVGYVYLILFMYSFLGFLIVDLIKLIFGNLLKLVSFGKNVNNFFSKIYLKGGLVFVISFIITVYSFINASNIILNTYDIDINKSIDGMDRLNIVMISDTHMGTVIKEEDVDYIVEKTNSLNPDIICLCGDIFDEGTTDELKEYAMNAFSKFSSSKGVFYITGNHEYYADDIEKSIQYIESAGIKVLRDNIVNVDDLFYVAGREDPAAKSREYEERAALENIIYDINFEKPIILLDHRPSDLKKAEELGVDLQLSGHTHRGQLFPINFISGMVNEMNYGHYNSGNYNIIVSSGAGTWGIPARVGSNCEIVNINVKLNK